MRCPGCGGTALEMKEGGKFLCASCETTIVLTPGQVDSLPVCPRCGSRNAPQASSCTECGAGLAKHCPKCGTRLELGMLFCDQCGANYEAASSPDGLCQWCGFQSAKEARFCDKCGARLIMTCPSCSAETKAGLSFCKACGFDYETLLQSEEQEPTERRRWPWSRRNPGLDGEDEQDVPQ